MAVWPPETFRPRRPDRLWTGLVEARSVRLPRPASQSAVVPAIAVLPTPPLPPKNRYWTPGWSARYPAIDVVISRPVVMTRLRRRRRGAERVVRSSAGL